MSEPPAEFRPLTAELRRWSAERGHLRAFTFVEFPEVDSPGVHRSLSWQRVYQRAQAVAERLSGTVRPGDRAALMLPQGLDYVVAFLGCLYARVIAVPLFSPDLPGHQGRLAAVLDDCEPACVLSDAATAPLVRAFAQEHGNPAVPVVLVDELPDAASEEIVVSPDADDIAYLQYTSGSTRTPAGVMISHGNVAANALQTISAFDGHPDRSTTVGWLPLFHDMGLVLSVAAPIVCGVPSVLMDPVSFLEEPVRWLRLLGSYRGTISAAPNFAYDYCASRIDADQAAGVRGLERVRTLINGSEPVRTGTIDRFQEVFGPAGLPAQAHCPSYGLAEATVFVAADPLDRVPHAVVCEREALTLGRIEPVEVSDPAATSLVACGGPVGQELCVTDPDTGTVLPEGRIGEIRLRGPNIGLGYWKRSERSADSFGALIPGTGEEPWLRTGDLGAVFEGQLLVTGRLKDLIIVDGRNHYPQDLEETVQSTVDAVRRDRLAAFAVPTDADGDGDGPDRVIVVAEHRRDIDPTPALRETSEGTARAQVSRAHGVRLDRLLLVPPGTVPRTSSGKVSRSACRAQYLTGAYAGAEGNVSHLRVVADDGAEPREQQQQEAQ
ncbi:fatty acyl-AMP ligase [Streptomyces sp. NBC_01803]|uniref:fatty acyl-AMP ligase n=1 Tax=Streptomyces sp. NBC_01803 TaxID=2975946 RepID=UPI002DD83C1A|nr:fatty acyl-AMP ligase [Streptomyces sp. NBC_01803]WSA46161.1 fatty acyl-AMP ligase [Streptomyces sp. NBC_01803]